MLSIILLFSWIMDITVAQKCQINILDSIEYVGCFVDSDIRLLPHENVLGSSTDNNRCILHCRDSRYLFAGTQFGTYCYCGNNPWWYTAADVDQYYIQSYDCNHPCSADSTQICGGGWRLSVFSTGFKNVTFPSAHTSMVERQYVAMGVDMKINDNITAILNFDCMSTIRCAAWCSMEQGCTGFVYSTMTAMCQLYQLKYHDLCDYVLNQLGSSIYMME